MYKRNLNYDLVRLLGLLVIMVAHSSPPGWIFQLRNFGTPLLVIGSGLTYALIYSSRKMDVKKFYTKRLTRLILPTWIFLSFFFLVFYFAAIFLGVDYPFSNKQIAGSYLFMNGVGFVWVFKIYLMLALITPIAIYLNVRIKSNFNYLASLAVAYLIYEVLLYIITPFLYGVYETIFNSIVFILIPYTILFLYAFRLAKLKKKHIHFMLFLSISIFSVLALLKYIDTGSFVPTQLYKYPPTIYYLSYAFFAINVVFLAINNINLKNDLVRSIIVWLSSNSLWIYLWHILAFYIWSHFAEPPNGDILLFSVKVIFLFMFGILFTRLQNTVVFAIPLNNLVWKNKIAPLLSSNAKQVA